MKPYGGGMHRRQLWECRASRPCTIGSISTVSLCMIWLAIILVLPRVCCSGPGGSERTGTSKDGANHKFHSRLSPGCSICGNSKARFGIPGPDGKWRSLFCKACGVGVAGAFSLARMCSECNTMGIFGKTGGGYGGILHCRKHRLAGETDVKHQRCTGSIECDRWPAYGEPGSRAARCSEHVLPSDVYMRKRRKQAQNLCRQEGCTKSASFGVKGGEAEACGTHKEEHHSNVRHRRCQHLGGCNKQPAYGSPGDRKRLFCASHRRSSDCNVVALLRRPAMLQEEGCAMPPCDDSSEAAAF